MIWVTSTLGTAPDTVGGGLFAAKHRHSSVSESILCTVSQGGSTALYVLDGASASLRLARYRCAEPMAQHAGRRAQVDKAGREPRNAVLRADQRAEAGDIDTVPFPAP